MPYFFYFQKENENVCCLCRPLYKLVGSSVLRDYIFTHYQNNDT